MSGKKVDEKAKGNSSTVYYQQLQSEYNDLLKRYAQAENTIDQLKTGARIHLYTDPQDAKPNTCGNSEKLKHSKRIDFPCASQAVMSNVSACEYDNGVKSAGVRDRRNTSEFEEFQGSSTPGNNKQDDSLLERIQSLKDNVHSLENYLRESDVTPTILNEVSGICKQLEEDHKELCRELKTYKHPPLIPSSQSETFGFTSKKDLDKELYRIGLRLKEFQQEIPRRCKGKASPLAHNEQAKEPISKRVISQKIQGASALDPDLTNLLSKLKDQQDAIARTNKEILRSCSPDVLKDSSFEGLRTEEPRRGRGSSSSSSESRDVVDARYLTASPVPEYGLHEDLGNEDERYSSDLLTPENDETFEEVSHPVLATRTFASSYHDSPSQQKKPSHSVHDHRHSLDKSRRPVTRNREESHSYEDLAKDKRSRPLNSLSHPETKTNHENDPSHHSEGLPNNTDPFNANKAEKNAPPVRDERGKSNSMSSLVDSSRMSTPLFHPRGATRVSPRDHQGGTRTGTKHSRADGFDSGFVGSEESRSSRMTTESPDIMQKHGFSYPWDSNSHLDLVSEIDEDGDSAASQDHLSTTYKHVTETARRSQSPVVADRPPPRDKAESTLANSSPSPPSSPVRTRRKPARYFGYSTSRGVVKRSSSESSLPGPHVQLSDPTLSRISEKTSSERSSRLERRPGASGDIKGRKYNRAGFQESTPSVTREDHNALNPRKSSGSVSDERTGGDKNERDPLFSLRHDINGLRNQIKNLLNEPRVTLDMYDDLRRQDEQFRRTLERKYERKLDELRGSIDRLAEDLARTSERKSRQTTRDRNSYDDFRSQLKTLTEKLDELSELRSANQPTESNAVFDKDDIGERVRSLAHKVDGLKLRVESDDKQNMRIPKRYFCDEASCSHHGFNSVLIKRKPPTSTPLLSEIYETSRRQRTNDLKNRPTFRHLSSTYPGVQTRSPVIHHIHTYHRTPTRRNDNYESDSNSEEELSTRRSRHQTRRLRGRRLDNGQHLPLAEANQAARDVQRLSKNMLRKMSWDLASFKT